MNRLTKRTSYVTVEPPYQLVGQSEEDDWHKKVAEKLAYYEDLEERCEIIIGATIEDSICSYEKLEKN